MSMSNKNNLSAEVVFEYTGEECEVPKDVTIVRFHPSVIEVENDAFYCCKQLREVVFNERLQKIGDDAFRCCTSLSSITFPSTVTEIGVYAFAGCKNLWEVVFHEGIQKIGNCVFQLCNSLESVKLPSTVIEIDSNAFNSCDNLREVVFQGVPREIGQYAFYGCSSLERFTFPIISARLENLIQTGHWEDIENELNEVRGVVEMSDGELFASTQTIEVGRNWNAVRRYLNNIVRVISYYELNEGTSIFELALWKFKLDQVDAANPIPRKKCRMDVPGPVKDIILQYMNAFSLYQMFSNQADRNGGGSNCEEVEMGEGREEKLG